MKDGIKAILKSIVYISISLIVQAILFSTIQIVGLMAGISENNIARFLSKNYMVLVCISYSITLIIYSLYFNHKGQGLLKRCRLKKLNKQEIIYISIATISIVFASCSFVNIFSGTFKDYSEVSKNISFNMSTIIGGIIMVIFIPTIEEIIFRGLVFREFRRIWSFEVSCILQAVIFGVMHGNMMQGIYTFLLGISLAFVYESTGSIYSCILMHSLFNLLGSTIVPGIISYTPFLSVVYLIVGVIVAVVTLYKFYFKSIELDNFKDIQYFKK